MLEHRSNAGKNMVAALRASVPTASRDFMERGADHAALWTNGLTAETPLHDGVQASLVVRVLGFELSESVFWFGHDLIS